MSGNIHAVSDGSGDGYDLDALLGAYALDAVDDDERRRVEDYLAIHPRAEAEVREHREVATMLAFTGMDAPEGLWDRIERELEQPAPDPGPELAKVMSLDERPRRSRLAAAGPWLVGAAAAAVLAVVAVGVVSFGDGGTPSDPMAAGLEAARIDRDSVSAQLVSDASDATADGVIDQDGHGYLDASGLPSLPTGQTYQLWGVMADGGDVISLGILGPTPEVESFTVEGEVAALAITIEQAPGVVRDGNPAGAFVGELA